MTKNNRGFSIVELLIVVGMLGGVSLVVMNIGKLSKKSSVKLELDTDITLTTNEINGILSDPVKCLATLGTTAAPTSINGKFFTQGSGSAPATGYGNSKLNIVSYNLTTTGNDGVLTILYENKNFLKGESGPSAVSKKINLFVEGSPGAITKCRSLSTAASDIWTRTGNDISYNNGNVGIGATLEVTGGVKIGSVGADASTTCASPIKAGTTRYNATSDKMEYCNKLGAWVAFGSGTAPAATGIAANGDGRMFSDNTFATSCKEYKNSANYSGLVGDGVYTIDSGGGQQLNVYCDMTADGGGWTLVMRGQGGAVTSAWASYTNTAYGTPIPSPTQTTFKYTDTIINLIRGNGIYRLKSDGTFNHKRFFGNVAYAHNTTATGVSNHSYPDATLTNENRTPASDPAHLGLSDWCGASNPNALYFMTSYSTGNTNAGWILGNNTPSGTPGYYCYGVRDSNCNFTMWVR